MKTIDLKIDPGRPAGAFPRIHEGRYEVDPEKTQICPPHPGLVEAVRLAGIRLLRIGVGVWLPSQEPNEEGLQEREWFRGKTMADVEDESQYTWTHLDRILETVRTLGCEALLSIDYMPETLSTERSMPPIPPEIAAMAPGYTFPNGVRNAPPQDPQVFAAACVKLLDHVKRTGTQVRYVELWNEPDLPFWWCAEYGEFFEMYSPFAKAVSEAGYRVGGPAWAGLRPDYWSERFAEDVASTKTPMDFYSWHAYHTTVEEIMLRARRVREVLDSAGLTQTESILDEWGYDLNKIEFWGTVANAAFLAASLIRLPEEAVVAQTHSLLVDPVARELGRFHGPTRKDGDRNPIFYAHLAFERFMKTPRQVPVELSSSKELLYALAGVDDADSLTVIAANTDTDECDLKVSLASGEYEGIMNVLTQESFDASGGWEEEPIRLTEGATGIHLQPGSFCLLTASRSR